MKSLYGKRKSSYKGLKGTNWFPTKEYNKYNSYCIDNNIRIFPIPTVKGMYPDEWRIGVCLGPYKKGEKPYLSPNVYVAENIYQEMEQMKKYYYDKRKIND